MIKLTDSIDAYIEYAEKTKKFSDVAFYEKIKARIAELEGDTKCIALCVHKRAKARIAVLENENALLLEKNAFMEQELDIIYADSRYGLPETEVHFVQPASKA